VFGIGNRSKSTRHVKFISVVEEPVVYAAAFVRPHGTSLRPTHIFTIRSGTDVSTNGCADALLATLANDPNAASYSGTNCGYLNTGVYNSSLPQGLFQVIPDCPGTQCTAELNEAFAIIANKVLLRLSQ
jgi:hypothetical protein